VFQLQKVVKFGSLYSFTTMLILMIFYLCLLPQLSEKREERQICEKNAKTSCETAERGKTNGFDN